jgi:hypothetical protein
MKKVNVYFAEPQLAALAAAAAQLGIPAAEILRRALDTWLAHHTGGSMAETTPTTPVVRAYVKLVDEEFARSWRHAEIVENEVAETVEVWRGDSKIARFHAQSVDHWYLEEAQDA